jgi:hypothetical protein
MGLNQLKASGVQVDVHLSMVRGLPGHNKNRQWLRVLENVAYDICARLSRHFQQDNSPDDEQVKDDLPEHFRKRLEQEFHKIPGCNKFKATFSRWDGSGDDKPGEVVLEGKERKLHWEVKDGESAFVGHIEVAWEERQERHETAR